MAEILKKENVIINTHAQMIETSTWKKKRRHNQSRLCGKCAKEVMHLASRCHVLAGNKYLTGHNVLKVLTTT